MSQVISACNRWIMLYVKAVAFRKSLHLCFISTAFQVGHGTKLCLKRR